MSEPQLPANISRNVAKLSWPKVSPQFAFDRAAPRVLRNNDKLPVEATEAFRHIWDGVVVEVGQYFDTHTYREARKPKNLRALLNRMQGLLNQAQELAIVCGTYWPLPGSPATQAVIATGGTAAVTGVEQLVGLGSVGMAATGIVASSLLLELYETYVAASARTQQYRAAQRDPDHVRIAVDLADAWTHRRTEQIAARQFVDSALERLERRLAIRSWRRVLEAVSVIVGVVWAAGSTTRALTKALRLPMRPADEDELKRMAEKLRPDGQATYDERIRRLSAVLAAANPS